MSLLAGFLERFEEVRTVPIDRCYHYRGYRYGGFGNNPYEDYVLGLARGDDLQGLRARIAEVALHCAPRTLDEALQIPLRGKPLWAFPWGGGRPALPASPSDNVDVMTFHVSAGVLASKIHLEFGWLEGAFARMRDEGYRPARKGYIRCLELRPERGESSYLVLDGNHRLASLHALGVREAALRLAARPRVRRAEAAQWPAVRSGEFTLEEALAVFDRYFRPDNPIVARTSPLALIEDVAPRWRIA